MTKAIALFSGGLDSILSVRVLQEQGLEIEALHFVSAFADTTSGADDPLSPQASAQRLGVPLTILEWTDRLLALVKSPDHGYGKNLNPCIDCRIEMLREAAGRMAEAGASFLVTGEVLGQRPMSQRRDALLQIEKEAGVAGLVLRPLSAPALPPTVPETEGWIDRERLPRIIGRGRKEQIKLAAAFGIESYPSPAGGCLLTDPTFSHRMRDLLRHTDPTPNDIQLLKLGRHFRLDNRTKIVVGRHEEDNSRLLACAQESDALLELCDVAGPLTLLRGEPSEEHLTLAAALTARYSKARDRASADVTVRKPGDTEVQRTVTAAPIEPQRAQEFMITV